MMTSAKNSSHYLPLELVDKCRGNKIWVILSEDYEFVGTLVSYDDFVNLELKDVTEIEHTPEGIKTTKIDEMFLNGSLIAMLIPGGNPDLE